jgi:uncharacterized protein (TIGR02145 family)
MKLRLIVKLLLLVFSVSVISCKKDDDNSASDDNSGNNNSGNNNGAGNTTAAAHSCGASNVHNPTISYGTMTDQEGNTYKTVVIGEQEWMAENLNTGVYRNGDEIPEVPGADDWDGFTEGAWVYQNNDINLACPFGKLYNWVACDDSRGLCPSGWHVPDNGEWRALISYLDPSASANNNWSNLAGDALKSTGTIEEGTGWWHPELFGEGTLNNTNSSGFSGIPGDHRYAGGTFYEIGYLGGWWSSTGVEWPAVTMRSVLTLDSGPSAGFGYKPYLNAYSVRCIRD